MRRTAGWLVLLSILVTAPCTAQQPAQLTVSLQDALARARQYGVQLQTANIAALLAKEDRIQARAAALPSVNALNQFIYTEGNGSPSGVFISNDGVHVYNEQAVVHEELFSLLRRGEIRFAAAAEAVARAKAEIGARGLNAVVVQDYYAIVAAQRKVINAQSAWNEAQHFLDITSKQEHGGEVAHADVIKAMLQVQQRQRDIQDAQLIVQKAKLALAVIIFPTLPTDYAIVDDLSRPIPEPVQPVDNAGVVNSSPDVRAAKENLTMTHIGTTVARYGYLPSLGLDFWYGLNANEFAARSYESPISGRTTLPKDVLPYQQNLGYAAAVTLTVPIWNWGAIRSKVKQAGLREKQAALELTAAQKQAQADLLSAEQEMQAAQSQVDSLQSSAHLSDESLRLTLLRYQAGEATALEVVDAQTTAGQAHNAYDDGLVRYRVALANLQILMGTL